MGQRWRGGAVLVGLPAAPSVQVLSPPPVALTSVRLLDPQVLELLRALVIGPFALTTSSDCSSVRTEMTYFIHIDNTCIYSSLLNRLVPIVQLEFTLKHSQ